MTTDLRDLIIGVLVILNLYTVTMVYQNRDLGARVDNLNNNMAAVLKNTTELSATLSSNQAKTADAAKPPSMADAGAPLSDASLQALVRRLVGEELPRAQLSAKSSGLSEIDRQRMNDLQQRVDQFTTAYNEHLNSKQGFATEGEKIDALRKYGEEIEKQVLAKCVK